MVSFSLQYHEPNNVPHIIVLKSVYESGDEILDDIVHARKIAAVLIDSVIHRINGYNGWRKQKILKIKGYLSGENPENSSKSFDEYQTLSDINFEAIMNVFQNIVQSNDTLDIFDLDWQFTIDPNSLVSGSGGEFPPPSWVGKIKYRETWKEQVYKGRKVNCAAFAIVNQIYKNIPDPRYVKKAWLLQQEMGWGEFTDHDELATFVKKNPKYKLCILAPPCERATHRFIGSSWKYDNDEKKRNIIYLYYYQNTSYNVRHFAVVESPICGTKRGTSNLAWCWFCDISFYKHSGHQCEQVCVNKIDHKQVEYSLCKHCGLYEYPSHLCFHKKCKTCTNYLDVRGIPHRCPLVFKPQKSEHGKKILVYDIESRFDVECTTRRVITEFKMDNDGYFIDGPMEDAAIYNFEINRHVPNLVCLKDIESGEKFKFFGDSCIKDFLAFCFNYHQGECILLAHNASGYDSRLIFEQSVNFVGQAKTNVIMRGSKFMEMKIGNLIFHDVMLQIPGNLKGLAKDFGCTHQKGDFPFLFNKTENYNYKGCIPPLEYFSISNVRNQKQYDELKEWHKSWNGRTDWDFQEQLLSYCENDVDVLCEIVKAYNDVWLSKGIQPWLKPTGAGVVHLYMGLQAWDQLIEDDEPPETSEKEKYSEWLQKISKTKWWAVLKPYEHFFAHKALRGGRTEVKTPYYKLSDEDYAKGKRILYVDVCSMYPYQQIAHDFPVGTPKVHVWDKRYIPCKKHVNNITCDCSVGLKDNSFFIDSQFQRLQPDNVQDWFGVVCVDLEPPKKMIHPVLVCWSEEMSKCIATLDPNDHKEIIIGTNSLHTCLANGYKLKKVYCYHEYNKGNFWREPTLKLYLEKMLNSKNPPPDSEKIAFEQKWGSVYGEKFANMIRESWPRWGKFSAKKFVAKIAINSVWGKHAQRVIMPKTFIFDFRTQMEDVKMFFKNCYNGREMKNAVSLGNDQMMYTALDKFAPPNLHNQYLPAGLMVPEYGRLQLWKQMNALGDRVLYCDTDSIIYVYDPEKYNVPIGDMVGDWEIEDVCSREIMEFVAWGPKSYGIKCKDGYTSIKAKGVCIKRSSEKLMNFEVMKKGALEFLQHGKMQSSFVPQLNFVWNTHDGMRTINNFKECCIKAEEIKGVLKDGYIYPFGYDFS